MGVKYSAGTYAGRLDGENILIVTVRYLTGRHFGTLQVSSVGLKKELIQELQKWSSSELADVYSDNTAKDKKFLQFQWIQPCRFL